MYIREEGSPEGPIADNYDVCILEIKKKSSTSQIYVVQK